nr:MAG TPA: hypothetical protein [Caudoviricetes sp.]
MWHDENQLSRSHLITRNLLRNELIIDYGRFEK